MNENINYSTFADFDTVKGTITNLYFMALNVHSEYILRPDYKREKVLREVLTSLSYALAMKMYIIDDDEQKKYIAYYLSNPQEFKEIKDLSAVFSVCQRVIEVLGITKIETPHITPWSAFSEVE